MSVGNLSVDAFIAGIPVPNRGIHLLPRLGLDERLVSLVGGVEEHELAGFVGKFAVEDLALAGVVLPVGRLVALAGVGEQEGERLPALLAARPEPAQQPLGEKVVVLVAEDAGRICAGGAAAGGVRADQHHTAEILVAEAAVVGIEVLGAADRLPALRVEQDGFLALEQPAGLVAVVGEQIRVLRPLDHLPQELPGLLGLFALGRDERDVGARLPDHLAVVEPVVLEQHVQHEPRQERGLAGPAAGLQKELVVAPDHEVRVLGMWLLPSEEAADEEALPGEGLEQLAFVDALGNPEAAEESDRVIGPVRVVPVGQVLPLVLV